MATYDGVEHDFRRDEPTDHGEFDGLEEILASEDDDAIVIRDRTQATAWIEGLSIDLEEAR